MSIGKDLGPFLESTLRSKAYAAEFTGILTNHRERLVGLLSSANDTTAIFRLQGSLHLLDAIIACVPNEKSNG